MTRSANLSATIDQAGTEAVNAALKTLLSPYLPGDLIGGSVPYIPGTEKEAVWNAASQACGTDRIHFVHTVADKRVWYIAVPSSSLASNPDSWCPLAAVLPGNSEYWDKESVYIYEQEGTAAGLRWEPETGRMQIFVGPSRTILPRLQTLDANFITVNAERATVVPWQNVALNEEKLSRFTVKWLFASGLIVGLAALAIWLTTHMIGIALRPNLTTAERETKQATEELMMQASQAVRNDSDRHLFRLQELLNSLQNVNGTMTKFEVKDGKVSWEALIPPAAGGTNLQQLRAKVIGSSPDGRVKIAGDS